MWVSQLPAASQPGWSLPFRSSHSQVHDHFQERESRPLACLPARRCNEAKKCVNRKVESPPLASSFCFATRSYCWPLGATRRLAIMAPPRQAGPSGRESSNSLFLLLVPPPRLPLARRDENRFWLLGATFKAARLKFRSERQVQLAARTIEAGPQAEAAASWPVRPPVPHSAG